VRVISDTQQIQSNDWPKWRCTLWCNVNARIFVGIGRNYKRSVNTLITQGCRFSYNLRLTVVTTKCNTNYNKINQQITTLQYKDYLISSGIACCWISKNTTIELLRQTPPPITTVVKTTTLTSWTTTMRKQ